MHAQGMKCQHIQCLVANMSGLFIVTLSDLSANANLSAVPVMGGGFPCHGMLQVLLWACSASAPSCQCRALLEEALHAAQPERG